MIYSANSSTSVKSAFFMDYLFPKDKNAVFKVIKASSNIEKNQHCVGPIPDLGFPTSTTLGTPPKKFFLTKILDKKSQFKLANV